MLTFFNRPKNTEDLEKARRNFFALVECDLSRAIHDYEEELRYLKIIGRIDETQYTAALIRLNQYLTTRGYN